MVWSEIQQGEAVEGINITVEEKMENSNPGKWKA
jgi:hypothetical protein